jgi:hypothetical protein
VAGDGRVAEHAVGLVHGLHGGLGVPHGLVNPCQRIQRQRQQKRLHHLPAQRDSLGRMPQGAVQLVAGVQHLGDPDVGLTLQVGGEPATLGGEPQPLLEGA